MQTKPISKITNKKKDKALHEFWSLKNHIMHNSHKWDCSNDYTNEKIPLV